MQASLSTVKLKLQTKWGILCNVPLPHVVHMSTMVLDPIIKQAGEIWLLILIMHT